MSDSCNYNRPVLSTSPPFDRPPRAPQFGKKSRDIIATNKERTHQRGREVPTTNHILIKYKVSKQEYDNHSHIPERNSELGSKKAQEEKNFASDDAPPKKASKFYSYLKAPFSIIELVLTNYGIFPQERLKGA